jgi:ribose/xylose/arabinose/galactoside ABC-type transport system permease subunit
MTPQTATTSNQPPVRDRGVLRWPPGALIIAAYVLLLIVTVSTYPQFFATGNLENLGKQSVAIGLVAVGVTFVVIGGNYDLSVGGIAGLAGVLYAGSAPDHGAWFGVVVGLLAGAVCGLVNGVLVTALRINSFMCTFATGAGFLGLALKQQGPSEIVLTDQRSRYFATASVGGVPVSIIVLVLVLVVGAVLLSGTKFGQDTYAVGAGAAESARLAGVAVRRVRVSAFVISGLTSGAAGAVIASQIGVGSATSNSDFAIDALAIVVVGGISIVGGSGAMWRTVLGLLILATMNNLFDALSWSTQSREIAVGAVILIALAVHRVSGVRPRQPTQQVA